MKILFLLTYEPIRHSALAANTTVSVVSGAIAYTKRDNTFDECQISLQKFYDCNRWNVHE